jgi:hypothetical protein
MVIPTTTGELDPALWELQMIEGEALPPRQHW